MEVKLVAYTKNPMSVIENVACNCYDSTPTDNFAIAQNCYNSGHLSVFEFAQFHFHVEGVSRALMAQITRHRTGKFCIRSQRYVDESKMRFVLPESIESNKSALRVYSNVMNHIEDAYTELIENFGIPKEDARMVLPNACTTVIDFSIDGRNLMHFFNERLCSHAQWEIRELAQAMKALVVAECPEFVKYCVPKCEIHSIPYCTEKKCCGRHKKLEDIVK